VTITVSHRTTCRLCDGTNHDLGLRLEPTPIGDDFVREQRLNDVQETFPLDLHVCRECGAVQLLKTLDPEVVYGDYLYTSSTSLGLPEHFQRYADDVVRFAEPAPGAFVVELGSNEGAMLRAFKQKGLRVLGVDPATQIANGASAQGLDTLPAFFSAALARDVRATYGSASIVVANNVFANIDDLGDVAEGLQTLLAADGLFVFETSYLLDVVEKDLIDTVFHEHLSYFAVAPLARFFARHGLELIRVDRVSTKGGSLRGYVQRAGGPRSIAPSVAHLIEAEQAAGIHRPDALLAMGDRLDRLKRQLLDLLDSVRAEQKTVASYGAAVGLTTMIYQFDLAGRLDFIVDDSPTKQGTFSPGHHLPVHAPEEMLRRQVDYVLVLAWRYADTIIARNQAFIERGGRFIVPLPELKIV
jgi:hypothetical protein